MSRAARRRFQRDGQLGGQRGRPARHARSIRAPSPLRCQKRPRDYADSAIDIHDSPFVGRRPGAVIRPETRNPADNPGANRPRDPRCRGRSRSASREGRQLLYKCIGLRGFRTPRLSATRTGDATAIVSTTAPIPIRRQSVDGRNWVRASSWLRGGKPSRARLQ